MSTANPLSAAAQAAEDRPGLAIGATIALAALVAPAAMLGAETPVRLLEAVIALAIVGLCLARVEYAILLLVASAPLEGAFQISANPQLTITKLAGAVCFASFAVYALSTGRRLVFDRTHALVLGILALAMISTVLAEDLGAAKTTTIRYGSFVALYIVISQFSGNHRLLRRIAWAMSLSAGLAALLAVNAFISGNETQARLPYADPNDTAYILATTIPLTLWLFRYPRARLLVVGLVAVMSASIVLSFSRGALVGLAAALVWHVLTERRGQIFLLLGAILVAVVSTALFVQANPSQVESGLKAKQNVASANVNTRLDAWSAAARLGSEHPFGVGPGNFRNHYLEETGRPPGSWNIGVVHNAYLDVAAEIGPIAMVLFLLYLISVFARAGAARRRGNGPPGLATAVRTALVIACVSACFLSEQYYAPFWLLGALATAMWREGEDEQLPAEA
jgi:O-antigen ligase